MRDVVRGGIGSGLWPACLAGLLAAGCAGSTPLLTYDRSGKLQGALVLPDGAKVTLHTGLKWNDVSVTLAIEKKLDAPAGASARSLWVPEFPGDADRRKLRLEGDVPRARVLSADVDPAVERRRLHPDEAAPAAAERPAGKAVVPLPQRGGRWSKLGRPLVATASTEANWTSLRGRLFDGLEGAPRFDAFDFSSQIVLVVSDGDGADCSGLRAEAWDDGARIVLRLEENAFRPLDGPEAVRAFGVFVLPRTGARTLAIQRLGRGLAGGGSPAWEERAGLTLPPDPATELLCLAE